MMSRFVSRFCYPLFFKLSLLLKLPLFINRPFSIMLQKMNENLSTLKKIWQ